MKKTMQEYLKERRYSEEIKGNFRSRRARLSQIFRLMNDAERDVLHHFKPSAANRFSEAEMKRACKAVRARYSMSWADVEEIIKKYC